VKSDSIFNIICLESNIAYWKEGFLKGSFSIDYLPEAFNISWILGYGSANAIPVGQLKEDKTLDIQFNGPNLFFLKPFKKIE